ncbi:MAG: DUF1538 family protein [Pseudomonadota bacterium]|nr:DUF1538 family protein [Pseudomonadota bacterium]
MDFFIKLLKESFRDLIPIVVVIVVFQFFIIQSVPDNWQATAIGLVIVGFGLAIFLLGLEEGIFPVGDKLARDFSAHSSLPWLLFFGFMIGFGTTIAEPALLVIAEKAEIISHHRINASTLRYVVAVSVGLAIALGVYRIVKGHPIHYYIIAGYVLVVATTFFAPNEIVGLAYDLGGVTTSTVTVPLVAALGIGLASSIKGRNPVIDGFGLIAFASLTPMILVQLYGIVVYTLVDAQQGSSLMPEMIPSKPADITLETVLLGLVNVTTDVLPILGIIFFFQYAVLKKPIKNLKQVVLGFVWVIIGLEAFILGLELGLFSLGELMAFQLTQMDSLWVIYAFAFAIGFSTTMAEPSLMAIAKKAKEISNGRIHDGILRVFVALGVAVGITLGAYRIVEGGQLHYFIMAGYLVVIALTFITPKYIIPVAYDSGGVTTSTVTVPLVAALGLGLASNIEGRSPLVDGFGLIAFASLFPIISVMLFGLVTQWIGVKSDEEVRATNRLRRWLAREKPSVQEQPSLSAGDVITPSSAPLGGLVGQLSLHIVVAIVPKDKCKDAVDAAKEKGASGVTMLDAEGMGLEKFENMYRFNNEASDILLLFILPEPMVESVIDNIVLRLRINSGEDGVVFSLPIEHVRGLSLRQQDIFEGQVEDGVVMMP